MPWRGQRDAENCWGDGCGSEPCAENQDGADGLICIGRKIDKSYPNAAKLNRHPPQYSNAYSKDYCLVRMSPVKAQGS